MTNKDPKKLRFVRVEEGFMIPRRFIEQIKRCPFTADDFYRNYSFYAGPFSFLYVIADTEDLEDPIKGVLWYYLDPLMKAIGIRLLSLDKAYQRNQFIQEVLDLHLRQVVEKLNAKVSDESYHITRVYWWTGGREKSYAKATGGKVIGSIMEVQDAVRG